MEYKYSFSGADVRTFVYYPGSEELLGELKSLQTISVSVYEAKGQARALGYRGIKGVAKGVRTIAGSMILTVVNDHPLRVLMSDEMLGAHLRKHPSAMRGWSYDRDEIGVGTALDSFEYNNRLATLIPEFNLIMTYVTELDNLNENFSDLQERIEVVGASSLVEGINIIDVGSVTSSHDVISEVTISFIARNYKPLAKNTFNAKIDNMEKMKQNLLGDPMNDSDRLLMERLFGTRIA